MDGVAGFKTELVPIRELAAMGVGPFSIPVSSTLVVHHALIEFPAALRASATGLLAGRGDLASSFDEVTTFLGLPGYLDMENAYLPQTVHGRKVRSLSSLAA